MVTSALFHYLGPALAVLLFAQLDPLGVAWLRIAAAAAVFAAWRRPWRVLSNSTRSKRRLFIAFGTVLAAMNSVFYLAIDRLPLGTVGAIEFVGPIALAAMGVRSARNVLALGFAVTGVVVLADIQLGGEPVGFAFAVLNCALFVLYVVLGHRIARKGGASIDRLGIAMLIAFVAATPLGFSDAWPSFGRPALLLAGIGVGIFSSVIPYVCDQLALARLPRATFALMLALLPACAAAMGFVVLHQTPKPAELAAIALIIGGVAIHRAEKTPPSPALPPA